MCNVYLSQRRASSYLDGCRIFAVRVNLLVLTRPNLANNYRNSSVDFVHVHFVIVIVLVIQVLFRSNCTFYLSTFCISVLVLLLKRTLSPYFRNLPLLHITIRLHLTSRLLKFMQWLARKQYVLCSW